MRKSKWSLLYKIPLALIALSVLWVLVLKWVPVWLTPLMISRSIEYRSDDRFRTQKRWRRIEQISPELAKAVIAGEDNRFFIHKGFDWEEIDNAIEEHRRGGRRRGASTISQQTAKNVFLLPSKTWVRKAFEAYFTVLIELIWGKERILEVYLNVAEMGLGIYGAEAAAKAHFGVTAAKLSRHQSCLITACLPNPIARNASNPGPYTRSRASDISNLIPKLAFPEWLR
ncbi:MAG TPA: monofunctional biosynthetic peptidoglycan transglycosylase [Candidatus Cryptobacteroides sp.]|jgi:monofunctional biosynthetic peptidoglycan transglycosylase|nr:monofunctional biosynthetic peptidoglycan transglycosylase [Candidatus Cryptobacteroides sp.]